MSVRKPAPPIGEDPSPFETFSRHDWQKLAAQTPLPLTNYDIERLVGLGDPLDMREVDAIYRPISALLQIYVDSFRRLRLDRRYFLHEPDRPRNPFIIGVAGSVAVGKSSTSRLLRELLRRWPYTPRVQLITTDGFLFPNSHLKKHGIMDKKGFPESYDRPLLMDCMSRVKSGAAEVRIPVYSHVTYDIVPGEYQTITSPDILIVEGLNVLQSARTAHGLTGTVAVSDYFDFSIYVDADPVDIERWYINRFLQLRSTAFARPDSYFRTYATLDDEAAVARARSIWRSINLVNLVENIQPTRDRATLVIQKGKDHRVTSLKLRKI
ncbi:MAG: type I pantothenate kinase [Actinomycetaceae bacterium]|nr:type I pantothenate kinase [Actinomycetaceae bacterium]